MGFGHLGEYLYRSITESPAVSAKIEVRGMRRRRRPPALRARLHSSSPFDAARRLRCCQIVLVWNRTADKVRESGMVPTGAARSRGDAERLRRVHPRG